MNRGVDGQQLFFSDSDYALFLNIVERTRRELGFLIHCFCLMPNHFHLLIQLAEASMSSFMQRIESAYAAHFNLARARKGHVFQGRFPAFECFDQAYYLTLLRYIQRNPVKAGLVDSVGEWPWSSHRQIVSRMPGSMIEREIVLRAFGASEQEAVKAYEEFVATSVPGEDALIARAVFPSTEERALFAPWADQELKAVLQKLAAELCARTGSTVAELKAPWSRRSVNLRAEFARDAKRMGFSNLDAANFLGCSPSALSRARTSKRIEGV